MKSICLQVAGLLLCTNTLFSEQVRLPLEIRLLQQKRNAEISKIDKLYTKALERYKLQFAKKGDLENANLAQGLIDEVEARQEKVNAPRSVQEVLVESKWKVSVNKESYIVIFREDGIAVRDDTKERWWKWRIEDEVLVCRWFSSGWYRFDIPENPASDQWTGRRPAGGERIIMEMAPSK